MKRFELAVMASVMSLEHPYGRRIRINLEEVLKRPVSVGQVYTTLASLEAKSYLISYTGDPTPVRGGRAKRFYVVTPLGMRAYTADEDKLMSRT